MRCGTNDATRRISSGAAKFPARRGVSSAPPCRDDHPLLGKTGRDPAGDAGGPGGAVRHTAAAGAARRPAPVGPRGGRGRRGRGRRPPPSAAPAAGEQALPASENTPTVNNALPTEADRRRCPTSIPTCGRRCAPSAVEDPSGHALDAFFARLAPTDAQEPGAVTRILHYGDSTIASDYVSGTMRRRLQARFGDAGHGFILIANPWEWYFHNDVLHGSEGEWKASKLAGPITSDGYYGLGGVSFTSYGGGVGALRHRDARRLRAQGVALRPLLPRAARRGRRRARRQGPAARPLLHPRRRQGLARPLVAGARRRGEARACTRWAAARCASSAWRSSATSPASSTTRSARTRRWRSTGSARTGDALAATSSPCATPRSSSSSTAPTRATCGSSIATSTSRRSRGWSTSCARRRRTRRCSSSPRSTAPRTRAASSSTKPVILDLVAIQRRVALGHGAAFWCTFDAMGGEGSMARWVKAKPQLGGGDLTHPTPLGAEVLGDMLSDALVAAYRAWRAR